MPAPLEGRSAEKARRTLPFAVVSYGTRRPTQFVPPTKWRESSCARCSTPSGVGTPRLIVSPDSSASARSAGAASSTRVAPPSRYAKRRSTGPGATRRSPPRWSSPRRSSAPINREVVDFGRVARSASSPTPSGRVDSTTCTSSSAARSIACVPSSGGTSSILWNSSSNRVKSLPEQRAQVVVQEGAARVELAANPEEVDGPRVALEELLAGQEMQLPPVDARVEPAEQPVDVAKVRQIVGAGRARDGDDDGVAPVAVREERLLAADCSDLHRKDRRRQAPKHQLPHRRERLAAALERDEVLELVEVRLVHHRIDPVRRPDARARLVRVGCVEVDLAVDLDVAAVGELLARTRKAVERRRVLGRHPEERVVAVLARQ